MNKCFIYFYSLLLIFFSCLPAHAQEKEDTVTVGKLIQESFYNSRNKVTYFTYYIASDVAKIERFIRKGHWKSTPEKRYTPYNSKTMVMIDSCFKKTLRRVLTKEQKDSINPLGSKGNLFMSQFYIFVKSRKRFVKLELTDDVDKFLTKKQIYKILRLYSKCKLPIHPVAGQLKEKEYYITGATVDKLE